MKIKYNAKLSNVFYRMTYDQFQLSPCYKKGFSKEEIEWALYEANYRYFGSYEFTDQQNRVWLWIFLNGQLRSI